MYYNEYMDDYRIAAVPYTEYTLAPYDTLYNVAEKYGISLQDLMNYNNISPTTKITPGMKIRIPNFAPPIEAPVPPSTLPASPLTPPMTLPQPVTPVNPIPITPSIPSVPENGNTLIHVVRRGETLRDIARRYMVSVENIMYMNNLYGNRIYPGERLRIPIRPQLLNGNNNNNSSNINYDNNNYSNLNTNNNVENGHLVYSVRAGDNLYRIAESFGITVRELKEINGLTSDFIRVGEELIIPRNMYN